MPAVFEGQATRVAPRNLHNSAVLENASSKASLTLPVLTATAAAAMADLMDVDGTEARGTKRTADEADLPPEAPRRIKACQCGKGPSCAC